MRLEACGPAHLIACLWYCTEQLQCSPLQLQSPSTAMPAKCKDQDAGPDSSDAGGGLIGMHSYTRVWSGEQATLILYRHQ